jgi:hypothetical protein
MGVTLIFLGWGLFWLSMLRLFMYLAFERRQADVARSEARDAIILELTRKVDALAQHLIPSPEQTLSELVRKVEALEQRVGK